MDLNLPQTFVPGFHDKNVVKNMSYNILGCTGLKVSKLSLGTGGFSYFYGDYSVDQCKQTIYEAIKSGINLIDTAPWYGHGESEKILGLCLEGIPREAYYLATKVCRYEKDPTLMFDFSAERTRKSIDESLQRLRLNYVDILQIHDLEFAPNLDVVLNETLPTVQEIIGSGKARHLGITGYPLGTIKSCIERSKVRIETVLSYCRGTMIDNTLDDFVPFFKSKEIGLINAAVNGMGLLTNSGPQNWHPASENIKRLCAKAGEYCKSRNVELGKLAVYDSLKKKGPDTILVGMNTPQLLNWNLNVLQNGITDHEEDVYKEVKLIMKELPLQSHWENVELEKFRNNAGLSYK
ncbi:uncharacterized protein LOC132696342 isoform X2 [Cylas formicarius]|nr:uncharacterized protein LOC132696342 isoform X2 [Cylas formicarius]XP_060517092.1 uncharacterized protein LOC132696342 isoform X2 [Cylas formicarius]XP_060517093.1 uncharacterized protein LOC132696342 isoform X2 [Cylas formicarius]